MKWHWRVRLYRPDNHYGCCEIITNRENGLNEIRLAQYFYANMTGGIMLIEGMSETPNDTIKSAQEVFNILWEAKP